MFSLKRIIRSDFVIKLRNWEYWPFGILQFPIFFYWIWLSIRSRSLLFFTASNPGITMGGMFGESKFEVLKKLPPHLIPKTILIRQSSTKEEVLGILSREGFKFPVIFKPDLGERGYMVKRIPSPEDIEKYLRQVKTDFLVQELVAMPLEFGVFYTKLPGQQQGYVTSVVAKEMLFVTGDGKSNLKHLILQKDRAKLQWEKLSKLYYDRLEEVLPEGYRLELVSIGNHALGTKFLDGTHLINDKLSFTFDRISQQIEGFYFGRFDLRCATVDDLYEGNVKIVELNGCGAEPAHIYDPDFSFIKAISVLFTHWRNIFLISRFNHRQGVKYVSLKDGYTFYKKFKAATQ